VSLPLLTPAVELPQAFIFSGASGGEIGLVFIVLLLLFGPRKLPEIARMVGKILGQLRGASNQFRDQLMRIEEEEPSAPVNIPPVDVEAKEVAESKGEEPADDSRTDGR
jgi:Sec-independent protein translocase protein TatA